MGFFPYEKFILKTSLSPSEVKERLVAIVEPPELFWNQFSVTRKPFRGSIMNSRFKIIVASHLI